MKYAIPHRSINLLYTTLMSILLVYLLIRCICVPLVHDESLTFLYYVYPGKYIPFYSHMDANNHVLNSFLVHICYLLFGKSAFALRIPNLLTFILYAVYARKLSLHIQNPLLALGTALALITAQFVVEFFGMSRGYGMSMAFLLMTVFYLGVFFRSKSRKDLLKTMVCMSLALCANLALIYTCLIIFFIVFSWLVFYAWQNRSAKKMLYYIPAMLPGLFVFVFLALYTFELKKLGALYYGSNVSFITVTLHTLMDLQLGSHGNALTKVIIGTFILMVTTSIVFFAIEKFRVNERIIVVFLLGGNVTLILLMGRCMGINYPMDRVGLYFIPLFILAFGFTIDALSGKIKWLALAGLPLLFFPYQMAANSNFSTFCLWPVESSSYVIHKKAWEIQAGIPEPLTIGGSFSLTWYQMNLDESRPLPPLHTETGLNPLHDLNIVRDPDTIFLSQTHKAIAHDDNHLQTLLQRKKTTVKKWINTAEPVFSIPSDQEFFMLYEALDTVPIKNLLFNINADISCNTRLSRSTIVFSANDKDGKSLFWEVVLMDGMYSDWNKRKLSLRRLQPKLPAETTRYAIYIFNPEHTSIEVKNVKVKLYEVTE